MKQRLKDILLLIIIVLGMVMMCSGCTQKLCPTYSGAIKAKELKKKAAFDAWSSDFCHVKPKKRGF